MANFSLDVDEIKKNVEDEFKIEKKVEHEDKLQEQAENNALAVFEVDFKDPKERQEILKPIEEFGIGTITRASNKNKLLSTRFVDFADGGDESKEVGEKLSELNIQIKDLDPSGIDFYKKGVLGDLFNPVRRYFNKYQKAESAISNVIKSLDSSSKILHNDNVTLLAEENYLRDLTNKLMEDIKLGKFMDQEIEAQIAAAEINGRPQEQIDFVREEILFPLRQRVMDMQQMIVVNQQAIVSLNVIRKNNKELIRGVDRAKNVTVTALRTGVMVASALYSQKITLDKIKTLNETTEDIIESTSRILRDQGNEIHKTSTESMISPEALKNSFNEAMAAIEDIDNYKKDALPKMKETIIVFNEMAEEGQKIVDKIELNE